MKTSNLTYWKWLRKWLRSMIKTPDKTLVYPFIFIFGALMAILGMIIASVCIVRGIYIGFLICLLPIPIGVLISLYGWYKGNVEPFKRRNE